MALLLAEEYYHAIQTAIEEGRCRVRPYQEAEKTLQEKISASYGLHEALQDRHAADFMEKVDPERLRRALPEIAGILDDLPSGQKLRDMMKEGGCRISLRISDCRRVSGRRPWRWPPVWERRRVFCASHKCLSCNIRITYSEIARYENCAAGRETDIRRRGMEHMRVGTGYDVHRLAPERKLILGGVEIPFELGLLGHSDADVVTHAVMDALLGAAALHDIGYHFPDSDPAYRGISSMKLLERVRELLEEKRYLIENIDATIIAQKPKLRPFLDRMAENMAGVLKMERDRVNIKATTEEGLGFTGSMEGIAAQAVCILKRVPEASE